MKLCYALLFLVLVAVAGCGKPEAAPAPALLGRWVYLQRQDTHFHRDGTLDWVAPPFKPAPGAAVLTVTADSIITRREPNPGVVTYVREGYARTGNVLEVSERNGAGGVYRYQLVIDELTAHRLAYHEDEAYAATAGGGVEFRRNTVFTR
jgi:hypothetical protein